MPTDIETSIEENAQQPAKASEDGRSVEQHPLQDQIAADRYLSAKDAARVGHGLGVRRAKLVPPGTA